MRVRYVIGFCLLSVFLVFSASAQSTMGSLTGTVTNDGVGIPGVTVTISSPAMQGAKTAITNEVGGYNFPALPPGEYAIEVNMEGMQSLKGSARVGLGQTSRFDGELRPSAITEALTVTASAPAVLETTEVQTNFSKEFIEELPIGRTLIATTTLAPGVVNGVNGLAISGANSYDNLWTVNGAVVNEGIRGQPHNLFIEDAIQETNIQTAGISAEYGNFVGGVINAITKSGGNEFSGSFRDSATNPNWTEASPFRDAATGAAPPAPVDKMNYTYEATLGGRLIRDRIWFFAAGRQAETSNVRSFSNSSRTYINGINDERREGKLTGTITASHSLVVSYLDAPVNQTNDCQIGCYDESTLNPARKLPNDFKAANYNGVFGQKFLLEARYSEKTFMFVNSGGLDKDLAKGTPVRLVAPGFGTVTNEPYFCGSCGPESRDNQDVALKATYFFGTKSLGSHDIVGGVGRFHETRLSNNFQSPTDYVGFFRTFAPTRDANGNTLISVGNNDILLYFPILQQSEGSDLNTNGYFINDKWNLNSKLSFNIGVRYDKNDSKDSAGQPSASDDKISPRLGINYDVWGNGRLRLNANYGVYVNRLSEGVSGAGSAAGNPATFQYLYGGAPITSLPPEQAMAIVFKWLSDAGGRAALPPCSATVTTGCLLAQSVPGFNSRLEGQLISPSVTEFTIGAGTQIGNGYVRGDYIHRDWNDFYTSKANLGIGSVTSSTGARADLTLTGNSDDFERTYDAIELQGQYRLLKRVNIGANYTWSELEGNIIGETTGNGPVAVGGTEFYPEYLGFAQNNPTGYLSQDQRHKLRVWAGIDMPTPIGTFNFSALERYDSGTPYSLSGSINPTFNANFYGAGLPGGVVNPGYVSPQTSVTYFFGDRGEFRFEDQTNTDFAINYSTNPGWARGLQLFAQGELINAFNDDARIGFDTSILTAANNATSCPSQGGTPTCMARFNPLAGDVPKEGVHWRKGPNFGKQTADFSAAAPHVQTPRTWRFSVGLRF